MSLEEIFRGLFDAEGAAVIGVTDFLLCVGCALLIGIILVSAYVFRSRYTKSFVITLALLPAVVCVVIMMVNGNVGAGVAVAGAFSLVRFRSVPGTARDIGMLFLAMGAGLIAGMGYLAFALLFSVLLGGLFVIYNMLDFGARRGNAAYRTVSITIPEDLSYGEVFDVIFGEYTRSYELVRVKTTNMGSLFRLTYDVVLYDPKREKEMIDALRVRNGNLEISVARQDSTASEL